MRILLACERFGRVRDALLKKGHDAISCDILPTVAPGPHICGPLETIIDSEIFDMIIAFPSCKDLAVSGAAHFKKKIANGDQQRSIDFFMMIVNANCKMIAIENPIGIMSTRYRKPDQIIEPFWFGDSYKKPTCLWLKGLPLLRKTNVVDPGEFVIHGGKKFPKWFSNRTRPRDETFQGIADAMANQWT